MSCHLWRLCSFIILRVGLVSICNLTPHLRFGEITFPLTVFLIHITCFQNCSLPHISKRSLKISELQWVMMQIPTDPHSSFFSPKSTFFFFIASKLEVYNIWQNKVRWLYLWLSPISFLEILSMYAMTSMWLSCEHIPSFLKKWWPLC